MAVKCASTSREERSHKRRIGFQPSSFPEADATAQPAADAKAETKPDATAQPASDAKAETKSDATARLVPEANPDRTAEVDGEAEAGTQAEVTSQLVKRVHALYEVLGREEVQAVQDLERAERESAQGKLDPGSQK